MGRWVLAEKGRVAIRLGRCGRCGSRDIATFSCVHGKTCRYCRRCLHMGRVCACDRLIEVEGTLPLERTGYKLPFALSVRQRAVTEHLLDWWGRGRSGLLHAVCGAGKTELTFPVIARAVNSGKRVLIVSPRRDVVEDWARRLESAFSISISRYYGGEELGDVGMITTATLPCLVASRKLFDYLIVDESDAFPFNMDVTAWWQLFRLMNGVHGLCITATPSWWQRLLPTVRLSRRHHGFDLPVPRLERQSEQTLVEFCDRHAERPRLLFVPTTAHLARWQEVLARSGIEARAVSAADEERLSLLEWLETTKGVVLATTIWERGMTVRDVRVAVIESEHPVFSTSALVQLAGRAGRKADAPEGEVVFFYKERTLRQTWAIRSIERANRS